MPNVSTLRGIEQKRADYAYECAIEGSTCAKPKEYKSYVKKLPMLVKTNGLGAAFAFVFSKGKDGNTYELIYGQTAEWIKTKYPFTGDFSKFLITQNSNEYRAITNEVISLFTWLRRFAEGLIEGDDEQNG